jgi:hypothetical protein
MSSRRKSTIELKLFHGFSEASLLSLVKYSNFAISMGVAGLISLAFTVSFSLEKVEINSELQKEEFARKEIVRGSENLKQLRLLADLSMLQLKADIEADEKAIHNGRLIGDQLFDHILLSLSHETTNTSNEWNELWADARQLRKEDESFWAIEATNLSPLNIANHFNKLLDLSDRYWDLSTDHTGYLEEEIIALDNQIRLTILCVFLIQILGFLWGTRGDALIERVREQ